MSDAADLIMRASVQGGRQAVKDLEDIAAAAPRAEKATEGLSKANSRLSQDLARADAALKQHNAAVGQTNVVYGAFSKSTGAAGEQVGALTKQLAAGLVMGAYAALIGVITIAAQKAAEALINMNKASERVTRSTTEATSAFGDYVKAAELAERYTGRLRDMLNEDAEAARKNAQEKRAVVEENLRVARSALLAARSQMDYAPMLGGEGGGAAYAVAGFMEKKAEANIKALQKALRDLDIEQQKFDQNRSKGGRSYLENLRQQNAEFGRSRSATILANAEIEAAKPENREYAAAIREQARIAAAHANTEDRRRDSLKGARSAASAAAKAAREEAKVAREAAREREQFRDQIDGLDDRYATGLEAAAKRVRDDMAAARKALADGVRSLEWFEDMRQRILGEGAYSPGKAIAKFNPLAGLRDDREAIREINAAYNEAIDIQERLADQVRGAFVDGITAALNGDFANFFEFTLRSLMQNALMKAFEASFQAGPDGKMSFKGLGGFKLPGMSNTGSLLSTGAMVAGSAIGGRLGGGLAGAGAGAQIGSMIAPGIGTAIGAVLGGIAGLLGGGGKKKAEREEAARREAERQANIAKQRSELEISILLAQGKATEGLARQRALELEQMDASNHVLAQRLYALQDARDLENMQVRLLQAQGKASEALAITRRQELDATTDALKPLLQQIFDAEDAAAAQELANQAVADATNALTEAYQRQKSEIEATRDQMRGFEATFRDLRRELGREMGITSPEGAAASFRQTATAAALGDVKAMSDLPEAARQQVDLIKAGAKTELQTLEGIAKVREAVRKAQDTAGRQASIADQQLAALDASVAGLGIINTSVMTVAEGIKALTMALLGAKGGASGGSFDPTWGAAANVDVNKALAAATGYSGSFGAGGFQAWITGQDIVGMPRPEQWQIDAAKQVLTEAGQDNRIVGFARGGFHAGGLRIVGEEGPEIEATGPARYWNADQTAAMMDGGNGDVAVAIRSLDERLGRIEANTSKSAKIADDTNDLLERVTRGGTGMVQAA